MMSFPPLAVCLALMLSSCGSVEWPLPRVVPQDANRPSAAPTKQSSAPVFVGAAAVVAGRGDTVYGLSRRHRVPVRAIIEANRLRPPYHLNVGQRVVLPRARQHTVKRGETFYGIARRYGVSPYDMARANGLRPPYDIKVGQKLSLAGKTATGGKAAKTKTAVRSIRRTRTKPPPPAVARPPATTGKGFIWPVRGRVISGFGAKAKGLRNDGINIASRRGAPVAAAENGVVVYAGNELRGFGNLLLVKHTGGWVTAYAHTDQILVKRGARVAKGQKIATVGSTGNVKNPQLHFEMRRGRIAKDPKKHLRGA
ncbi:MAG: M23 family metallopeptidase [Alphaproteobacteria bacterium]|nr:M23 family metallopeptidase [Alphaproteobacteria bacterium]